MGRPGRERRLLRLLVPAHVLAQCRPDAGRARTHGRTDRALARRRRRCARARRPLPASRRAPLARTRQRRCDRVSVSRHLDRRRRSHRERPGVARLPIEGRLAVRTYAVEEIAGAIFAYFPTPAGEAPPPFDPPSEFTDPAWSHFVCETSWNTNYRYAIENVIDPMHGPYLHGDSHTMTVGAKDDVMGDQRYAARLSRVAQTAEGRRVRLDRVRRNRRALDAARHSLSGEKRPGRPVPRDRLRDPDRRKPCADLFLAAAQGERVGARSLALPVSRTPRSASLRGARDKTASCSKAWPPTRAITKILYQHDIGITRLRRRFKAIAREQIEAVTKPVPVEA